MTEQEQIRTTFHQLVAHLSSMQAEGHLTMCENCLQVLWALITRLEQEVG